MSKRYYIKPKEDEKEEYYTPPSCNNIYKAFFLLFLAFFFIIIGDILIRRRQMHVYLFDKYESFMGCPICDCANTPQNDSGNIGANTMDKGNIGK